MRASIKIIRKTPVLFKLNTYFNNITNIIIIYNFNIVSKQVTEEFHIMITHKNSIST